MNLANVEGVDVREIKQWWLVTSDCCGVFCCIITFLLMCYAEFVQVVYIIGPWKGIYSWYTAVYSTFFVLCALSHLRCLTQNPGAAPLTLKKDDPDVRRCQSTMVPKPKEAHHCSVCRRSIIRLDHYCPWVNNGVGYLNHKFFILFLFWTSIACLWCFVTLCTRFYLCQTAKRSFRATPVICNPTSADLICSILLMVEAVLFGSFTTVMMFDQLSCIFESNTYIDRLKGKKRGNKGMKDSLEFVFGEPLGAGWFFPKSLPEALITNFATMCTEFQFMGKKNN